MKALNAKQVQLGILPDGLRLFLIEPFLSSSLVSIELRVAVGWNDETSEEVGFSHWVEHMALGLASRAFPRPFETMKRLLLGGITTTAQTSATDTIIKLTGHTQECIPLLSLFIHWFRHPVFHEATILKERNAVLSELESRASTPWRTIEEIMHQIYYKNTRLAITTEQEKKHLRRSSPQDLIAFRQRHYIPEKSVLTLCVSHLQELIPRLKKEFGWRPLTLDPNPSSIDNNDNKNNIIPKNNVVLQRVSGIHRISNDGESLHKFLWQIPLPVTLFHDPVQYVICELLCFVLSFSDLSSRLLQRLRAQLGLIYWITFQVKLHPNDSRLSFFQIKTEADPQHIQRVLQESFLILKQIASTHPITANELRTFRSWYLTNAITNACLQTPDRYVNDYVPSLVHTGKIRHPLQLVRTVQQLRLPTIHKLVSHWLSHQAFQASVCILEEGGNPPL